MKTPIIAVSQRVEKFREIKETRDCLDQKLTEWVDSIGALTVPIPNRTGKYTIDWLEKVNPSAIILSGGNDIGSCQIRDITETLLIRYAEQKKLPLLGICRGMQMLGVMKNVPIIPVANHARTRHALIGDLVNKWELPNEVNSFHKYALRECPSGYEILARSPDGSLEAIRNNKLNWEGWMWHPEREINFSKIDTFRARKILIEVKN